MCGAQCRQRCQIATSGMSCGGVSPRASSSAGTASHWHRVQGKAARSCRRRDADAGVPRRSACQVSGIFGPEGRLAGDLKDCWADGLCSYEVPQFPRVEMS